MQQDDSGVNYPGLLGVYVCVCVSAVRMSLFTPADFLLLHRGTVTDWVIGFFFPLFTESVSVRVEARCETGTTFSGRDPEQREGGLMGVSVGCNGLSQRGSTAALHHVLTQRHTLRRFDKQAQPKQLVFFIT